ncbi:MAG: heparan-alpha-glucosaminide N-acetyltransferase [Eubacteriales bacterium]|nr:heparan-alpha-glucosaminide N-acetyltransferase [Eubacteriales bacterium]
MRPARKRLLDGIRGLTLLSMIAYHGMFDLVELFGVQVSWFWETPGYVWQQSICWSFILLSGFCLRLGRAPVRRGLVVSACGLVITAVTFAFLPSERILFGILTFTGAAMLITAWLSPFLKNIPAWAGLPGSALLFFLTRNVNGGFWGFGTLRLGAVPEGWYRGPVTTFLGFPEPGFFSGDYFSLVPWIFLYLCGYFLYGLLEKRETAQRIMARPAGPLEIVGRHSLPIYMLHQPALLAVLTAASRLTGAF